MADEYIQSITRRTNPKRHKFYKKTVLHAHEMGVHVEGFLPKKILEEKRPNESKESADYRLAVWKAVTKSLSDKIINTVNRIFNPKFFKVEWASDPSNVSEEDGLATYMLEDFGIYRSVWIFIRETLLKMTFSDPNAACLIIPSNILDQDDQVLFDPVPIIFRSEEVVDFGKDFFTIWQVPPKVPTGTKTKPGILWFIDSTQILKWEVVSNKFTPVLEFTHDFGEPPIFRLQGQAEGQSEPYWFSSFIAGIAPHWDKVVAMVSDEDVATVNYLFPQWWEYTDDCTICRGKSRMTKTGELWEGQPIKETVPCGRCSGTGKVTNRSPLGVYQVKREAINPEIPSPIPPAGAITKDISTLQELKLSIKTSIVAGYSAINLEVIEKIGAIQSGEAKKIDRTELDGFLMRVALHVFEYQWPLILKFVVKWRYGEQSEAEQKRLIDDTTVSKPKEFSILGIPVMVDELKNAANSNVSTSHIKHLETQIANTKFADNEPERLRNIAEINLRPFPNRTPDQLSKLLDKKAITKKDFIRNENIGDLVTISLAQNKKFLELEFIEQVEIINEIIESEFIGETPPALQLSPGIVAPPKEGEEKPEDLGELENEEEIIEN